MVPYAVRSRPRAPTVGPMPSPARLLLCLLMAAGLLLGPAAGFRTSAQERPGRPTTTLPLKGDRPSNYVGLGAMALGLTLWAVVFGVVLYRSPRRASALRHRDPDPEVTA